MSDNKTFWRKELLSNTYYINGAAVQFEPMDGNRGILELDASSPLNGPLRDAAQRQVGGIVQISQEDFTDIKTGKKKLTTSLGFQRRSQPPEPLRVFDPPRKPKQKAAVAEYVKPPTNGDPKPAPVVTETFRPTTKRLSELLKDIEPTT